MGSGEALPSPPDPQIEYSHISSTWIFHKADISLFYKAAFCAPSLCIYFSSGPSSWTGWQNRIRNKGLHAHSLTFKSQKWSTLLPCSSNRENTLCCSSGFHHLSDIKDFGSSDRTSTNTWHLYSNCTLSIFNQNCCCCKPESNETHFASAWWQKSTV